MDTFFGGKSSFASWSSTAHNWDYIIEWVLQLCKLPMSHWFVHLVASSCVTWWCHHIVTPSTVSQYCSRRSRKSAAAFDLQTQVFVWAKWTGESFFGMTGLTKDQQCLHATLDNRSSTLLFKQSTPEALSLAGNQNDNTLGATCMVWSQNSFLASSLFEKSCFLSRVNIFQQVASWTYTRICLCAAVGPPKLKATKMVQIRKNRREPRNW